MKLRLAWRKWVSSPGGIMLVPPCFIVLLLLMSVVEVWWPRAPSWSETIKLALSWPVLATVLLSCFIRLFEDAIRKFLSEVRDVEGPMGLRVSRQQARDDARAATDFVSAAALAEAISRRDSDWRRMLEAERVAAAAAVGQVHGAMSSQLAQARLESLMWRFRYAHVYLALSSKAVLSWFGQVEKVTREDFDRTVEPFIPDVRERQAILDALMYVGFIRLDGSVFSITDEGRLYLQLVPATR